MADGPENASLDSGHVQEALRRWCDALGPDCVDTTPDTLDRYARTTLPHGNRALAVVRPGGLDDVLTVVTIANAERVPLYPISCGKNWGYGDSCPPTAGQVILDLGRMNRILEVDEELAYAVIEPGVTQGQLSEYLQKHGHKLILDCTGAGPDASIVGNILERGAGHTPYGNRIQFVSGFEIVLGDGRVMRTGFGHFPGARSTAVFPCGPGPFLDGLFTQSNMGIVTKVALWLMPEPETFTQFICIVDREDDLGGVVDAMRRLRLQGAVRSIVHIGNDMRMISSSMTYPKERADGRVPLPPDLRATLQKEVGVGDWVVSGGLYGSRAQVAAAANLVRTALRGPGRRLIMLDRAKLGTAAWLSRLIRPRRFGEALAARVRRAQQLVNLHLGVPTGAFLSGAYWRHREGLPDGFPDRADPAQDGCGMLWLSPVLPQTGAAVRELLDIVKPIFREHGFDHLMTLASVNERAMDGVLTIAFDRHDAEETRRASACYQALFEAVFSAGFVPYRVAVGSMSALFEQGSPEHWETVAAIKRALDPNMIIAPGRYAPITPA